MLPHISRILLTSSCLQAVVREGYLLFQCGHLIAEVALQGVEELLDRVEEWGRLGEVDEEDVQVARNFLERVAVVDGGVVEDHGDFGLLVLLADIVQDVVHELLEDT